MSFTSSSIGYTQRVAEADWDLSKSMVAKEAARDAEMRLVPRNFLWTEVKFLLLIVNIVDLLGRQI